MPKYIGNGYGTSYLCVNDDCATSGSWSFCGDDAKERALELWNRRANINEYTRQQPKKDKEDTCVKDTSNCDEK